MTVYTSGTPIGGLGGRSGRGSTRSRSSFGTRSPIGDAMRVQDEERRRRIQDPLSSQPSNGAAGTGLEPVNPEMPVLKAPGSQPEPRQLEPQSMSPTGDVPINEDPILQAFPDPEPPEPAGGLLGGRGPSAPRAEQVPMGQPQGTPRNDIMPGMLTGVDNNGNVVRQEPIQRPAPTGQQMQLSPGFAPRAPQQSPGIGGLLSQVLGGGGLAGLLGAL